jgi:hypothetical protein
LCGFSNGVAASRSPFSQSSKQVVLLGRQVGSGSALIKERVGNRHREGHVIAADAKRDLRLIAPKPTGLRKMNRL